MAQRFPDPADLESAAQYRPSVGANILNLLTGGIYGGLTGKTQRAQEGETARQLLLREQLQSRAEERDLERQMQRRLLETALTAGVDVPQGGDIYQRMSALRSGLAKAAVESEAGARAGYGFADIPTAEQQQSLPYQRAASEAQMGRYAAMSRANLEEEINRPRIIAQAKALGVDFDPNTPTSGIEALVSKKKSSISQEVNQDFLTQRNKEDILLAQSSENPEFLRSFDVTKATPAQINANAEALDRWRKEQKDTAEERKTKNLLDYQNQIKRALSEGDMRKAQELVYQAPYREIRNDPNQYWQSIAQTQIPIPKKKQEELAELPTQMAGGVSFIKRVGSLAKGKNINEVSKMSFNALASNLDTLGAQYFGNDEARNALRAIRQEFEGIVSQNRKTLFGASLTGSELESARDIFGNKDSADFLPRAIQFMDKVFGMRPSERYPAYLGMGIHDQAVKPYMDSYAAERAKLNWLPFQSLVPSNQPVTVTGAAPAATLQQMTPEQRAARIKELQSKQ
jgi:hypothetical protein